MSDFNLKGTLTGDAGPLNAALRQGAQGVDGVADKVVAANKQMADSAKGTAAAQTQAAQTTKAAAAEAETAARRSAAAGSQAMLAQQQAMRAARAEANNLAQAYRQLPMQMTDVVTSLASGMPVWMVAIQQGGQIKDSFGGAAGMATELSKALTPLRMAMGGAAAAAVATAVAYNQGANEAQAYNRAIVLSGNAAGVTTGRLDAMARSVANVAGTQNQAAEALAMAAATGKISAGQMEQVALVAVRSQRILGDEVQDTVDRYAALGKAPVRAATELNSRIHFLTASVYDQIVALEKQGRIAEAGVVAQQRLAQVEQERLTKIEANLGSIERGWNAVKLTAAQAWDAMLGIGRAGTAQKELDGVNATIAAREAYGKSLTGARDAKERASNDSTLAFYRAKKAALEEVIATENKSAAREAETASNTESHIAAQAKREAAIKAAADAYKGLMAPIEQRIALAQAELVAGRELTASEQKMLQVQEGLRNAGIAINSEKGKQIVAAAQTAGVLETEIAARQEMVQILERERAAAYARGTEAEKEAEASIKSNDQLRKEIAAMGAKGEALLVLESISIRSLLATKEWTLAGLDAEGATTRETEALRAQIAALRERLGLLNQKGGKADKLENTAANDRARSREEEENRRRSDALADSITQGMVRGARTGENIMQVFRTQLEDEFARLVLKPIVSPVADAANQFIGMLLNAGMAYLTGGSDTNKVGGTDGIKFENAKVGHTGGVIGSDRMDGTRRLPSAMFESAPRYHKGMLAPDEHAAVLQTGESVLTPAQLRQVASMGAGLQVNVINQTGTPVKATGQANASGGFDVVLTAVEDAMADRVASGTGALHGAFVQRFGARSTFNS